MGRGFESYFLALSSSGTESSFHLRCVIPFGLLPQDLSSHCAGRTAFVRGVITATAGDEEDREDREDREIFTYSGVFSRVGGTKPKL